MKGVERGCRLSAPFFESPHSRKESIALEGQKNPLDRTSIQVRPASYRGKGRPTSPLGVGIRIQGDEDRKFGLCDIGGLENGEGDMP